MTKRLPPEVKQSRRPTRVACEFCHSKHLQCDNARPCINCVKRGVADSCKDAVRRKKRAPPRDPVAVTTATLSADGSADAGSARKKRKYKKRQLLGADANGAAPRVSAAAPARAGASSSNTTTTTTTTTANTVSASASTAGGLPEPPKPGQPLPFNLSAGTLNKLLTPAPEIRLHRFQPPHDVLDEEVDGSADINGASPEDGPLEFRAPSRHSASVDSPFKEDVSTNSGGSAADGSSKNFQSATANDEYAQLTDLLNTNPPSPTDSFWVGGGAGAAATAAGTGGALDYQNVMSRSTVLNGEGLVYDVDDDDDDDDDDRPASRPYIEIGIDENTMRSSYPNNSTPNSYIYNENHSRIANTAREIPHDLQEDEDYTSPLIMRHVIKKPDDIYLTNIVKAYQYPKAYHALIAYLKRRFNKDQLIEIAKCMAKYRPSFISATKSLYENDLIFTERSFQRTLLEYEQLISMSPSPTIIWRRTGEIVALTSEFATMTGYSKMSLLSKRTFICELMDDESTLKYFRSFSTMAFGDLNATYLTDCNIRKADDDDYLRCCCVWTIKRDVFDIPMLIVGQFLPVLE